MSDIFKEINSIAEEQTEGFLVEHAVQIDKRNNIVVAGIHIGAEVFHAPLFITADELRRMADEAERRTQAILDRQG